MSLDGQYDDDNIFARAIRGEVPVAKVYEDADVFAFMDLFPQSRGHCLVVSKTARARNLLEIEPPTLCTLMVGVQRLSRAVIRALNPDGLAVSQFNGAPAGQTVFHLHFHVIPRYTGQAMTGHGQAKQADPIELGRLARLIADAF